METMEDANLMLNGMAAGFGGVSLKFFRAEGVQAKH